MSDDEAARRTAPELLEEPHVAPVTHTRFAPTDADFGNLRVDDGAVRWADGERVSTSTRLDADPSPGPHAPHVKNGLGRSAWR